MDSCDNTTGWCLDKKVNLSALLSMITTFAVAIGLVVSLDARLDAIESRSVTVRQEIRDARTTALHVERIDERIASMQQVLSEIKEDLRQSRRRR